MPTRFTLCEDQGDGVDNQQGKYSRVVYTLAQTATGPHLAAGPREGTLPPATRTLVARVRRVDHLPRQVSVRYAGGSEARSRELDDPSVNGLADGSSASPPRATHPDTATRSRSIRASAGRM